MATKIRARWAAGLLEFFGITSGEAALKITESGIETPSVKGGIIGGAAITKADSYALSATDKANIALSITLSVGSKTITAGLTTGQVMFVHNADTTNAFTLKNIAGDTGTSIAAGKVVMLIGGSATANTAKVIAIN